MHLEPKWPLFWFQKDLLSEEKTKDKWVPGKYIYIKTAYGSKQQTFFLKPHIPNPNS